MHMEAPPAPEQQQREDSTGAPAVELSESNGAAVENAKDQLIATLSEELIKAKADLARIAKERCVDDLRTLCIVVVHALRRLLCSFTFTRASMHAHAHAASTTSARPSG